MDRLFLCIVGLGVLSATIGLGMDYVFLRPVYLPKRSERELRLARWRGVGSAVATVFIMWNLASFLHDPHQLAYLRLIVAFTPVGVVFSAMNLPLVSEARQTRRERRKAGTSNRQP